MEKGKKIKLVTFAPHPNFGTCLQSYALFTVLKKLGHDVEFIYNNNDFPKRGIIGNIKDIIKIIIPHSVVEDFWRWRRRKAVKSFAIENNISPDDSVNIAIHYPPIIQTLPNAKLAFILSKIPFYTIIIHLFKYRTKQWKKVYRFTFKDKNYKMRRIYTAQQYEEVVKEADLFITGSDQIWNPYCCGFNPMMFLEFVNGRKKCIAYSSSISRPDFPPEIKERAKEDLQKFEHIAVREQTSVELLKKLLGRNDIQLVVDPTYLLSEEEWKLFGERANIEFDLPSKYIFCYFIGNRHQDYKDMVEDIKEKTKIKDVITITIASMDYKINYGNGFIYKDGGPYEFIYLLNHASFICMDSFHATIFSLKFRKEFAHIMKTNEEDLTESSQNTRMYDILCRYNLKERVYKKGSSEWMKPIDWDYIESITEKEITDSMQYLVNAI